MCVCVKFLLPKQLKHTHPLSSVLQLEGEGACGGGDEKPSVFQASINELKLISESYWQTKCPLISLPSLSLSVTHFYLGKVSYEFQFMGIIKLQIVLGGLARQTVKKTVPKCF